MKHRNILLKAVLVAFSAVALTMATGCPNKLGSSDEQTTTTDKSKNKTDAKVDEVFLMAKAYAGVKDDGGAGGTLDVRASLHTPVGELGDDKAGDVSAKTDFSNVTAAEIKTAFDKLSDAQVKLLAAKEDGDYNFFILMAMGVSTPETVAVVETFFAKNEAAVVTAQVEKKAKGKTGFDLLRDTRKSGEAVDDRNSMLATVLSAKPELVNNLKDTSGNFDSKEFTAVIGKVKSAKVQAVVDKVESTNLATWSSWAVANKAEGQTAVKAVYGNVSATTKADLQTRVWTAANANYASLKAFVTNDIIAADTWGIKADILANKIDDIVAAQYAVRVAPGTGVADFAALYDSLPAGGTERAAMSKKLFALTIAENAAAVNTLLAAMAGGGGGDVWHVQPNRADFLNLIAATYRGAGNHGDFRVVYGAVANVADQPALRAGLFNSAIAAGAVAVNALLTNMVGGDQYGVNGERAEFIELIAAKYLAANDHASFVVVFNANVADQAALRTGLFKAAIAAGAAPVNALLANMAAGNDYGVQAQRADFLNLIADTYEAAANFVAFGTVYNANAGDQAALRARAFTKAVTAGGARVNALLADMAGDDHAKLNGSKNDLLDAMVATYLGANNHAAFRIVYDAGPNAGVKAYIRNKLFATAIATNAVAVNTLLANMAAGGDQWGVQAERADFLTLIASSYKTDGGKFAAVYTALANAGDQPALRRGLFASTIGAGVAAVNTLLANMAAGGDTFGVQTERAEFLTMIVSKYFADNDKASFKQVYTANNDKAAMAGLLGQSAGQAGDAVVTLVLTDIAGTNDLGLGGASAAANKEIILTSAAGGLYAANKAADFGRLYAAEHAAPAIQKKMVQALGRAAAKVNPAAVVALIGTMAPGGVDAWGVAATPAAGAANTKLVLEAIVSYQYAEELKLANSGKTPFKALFAAVGADAQAIMVEALGNAVAAGGYATVGGLLTDIALGAGSTWGLGATADAVAANTKRAVVGAVSSFHAAAGAGGKANFIGLYGVVTAIQKGYVAYGLGKAFAAGGHAAVAGLITDIALGGGSTWGLGATPDEITANTRFALVGAVEVFYATGVPGKGDFTSLFAMGAPITGTEQSDMAYGLGRAIMTLKDPADVNALLDEMTKANTWGVQANRADVRQGIGHAAQEAKAFAKFGHVYDEPANKAARADLHNALFDSAIASGEDEVILVLTDLNGTNDAKIKAKYKDEFLRKIAFEFYASNNSAGFKKVYAALAATPKDQVTLRSSLFAQAISVNAGHGGAPVVPAAGAGLAALMTGLYDDIKAGTNTWIAGRKDELVAQAAAAYVGDEATFQAAFAHGNLDAGDKEVLGNELIAAAFHKGLKKAGNDGIVTPFDQTDYETAVAAVGEIITKKYLDDATVTGTGFDPWGVGNKTRLMYAVFAKVLADGKALTKAMVASIAAPMKNVFTTHVGGALAETWQNYLSNNNIAGGTSIEADQVRVSPAVAAEAAAAVDTNENISKSAAWLDW